MILASPLTKWQLSLSNRIATATVANAELASGTYLHWKNTGANMQDLWRSTAGCKRGHARTGLSSMSMRGGLIQLS
jgi:hypothetical protein